MLAPGPSQQSALVGREHEQSFLHGLLAAARAGRGGIVLIGGEAGIGKTALADQLCHDATDQGAMVLIGRCYDLTETPPYGPWVELFRRYQAAEGLPQLPDAFAIAGTVGDVTSQAQLFQEVRDFLSTLAASRPVVLFLDDLHWADPASLDLLRFLARHLAALQLLVVVAYRADEITRRHPLYALLPLLVHEGNATRINPQHLTDDEVQQFVATRYTLLTSDQTRLVAYLQGRAEGNAFFLTELLRTLEETRVIYREGGEARVGDFAHSAIPLLLRQVIDGRLARLGEDARRLLVTAAIIGQEIALDVWVTVALTDEERLLDVIERAVEAHILDESADGTTVRFTHALIREALYESASATRRRREHRRIGETLMELPGADPDAVAFHLRQAGDLRATEWLIKAGERARRAYAWLTAADRFDAALALTSDGDKDARGWLLYRLAIMRQYLDIRRAIAYLDEAMQLAAESEDHLLAVYALFAHGLHHCHDGDVATGMMEMARAMESVEAMPTLSEAECVRLSEIGAPTDLNAFRGTYAQWLGHSGCLADAEALATRVIADDSAGSIAHGLFVAHRANALAGIEIVHTMLGRLAEVHRTSLRVRETNSALGHDYLVYRERVWFLRMVHLRYYTDRVAERQAIYVQADEAWEHASGILRSGDVNREFDRLPWLVIEGQWEEARQIVRMLAKVQHILDYQIDVVRLAYYQGDIDLAWQRVQTLLPNGPKTVPGSTRFNLTIELQRLAVALSLDADDLSAARAWLEAHDRWMAWSGAVLGLSEGAVLWARYHHQAGERERADAEAQRALAHATEPRQPLALLAVHRLLGELDTVSGRLNGARTHLDTALALADACAAPYERALTLLAFAELHIAAGNTADAQTALDEARSICTRLGAQPALARADRITSRLQGAMDSATYPAGLTAREVEVLRLVAEGLTDAQVAERLFLSTRTVNQHLRTIYNKLGVSSRAAATRFVTERGLLP
jgi:DNA-binding CsgD family transcriptional regulator/tetratricopeptide (TPR) repeat protein